MKVEKSDLDLLISRVLEAEAAPDEVAVLHEACSMDPELSRRFARETALHRMTGALFRGSDGESQFAAEVIARMRLETAAGKTRVENSHPLATMVSSRRWAGAFAMAAVIMLLVWLAIFLKNGETTTLVRCESLVWTGGTPKAAPGELLKNGRILEITSGFAELRFPAGVSVLLEGPARLRISGPKSAFLDYGRLVARVTEPRGRGFVIDGPKGHVVDLGTEFGVNVMRSGEMEVHVLEGAVTAASSQQPEHVTTLRKNEGMRLGDGPSSVMRADDGFFITNLPPVPGLAPASIHWSFDEPGGDQLYNTGKGLAEAEAGARLLAVGKNGVSATRSPGRYGGGLSFDGIDDFAESGFQGIAGQAPRTVSLWARIPSDLSVQQSYAMIGWGMVEGAGNAWQISVNPEPADGPLGALRAGTGQGAVVGSTDLRDGKWHHLTAVLYGGSPTTGTHVLLYVDGVLEPTTRKSVRTINTLPAINPHGVWLGRNLAQRDPDPEGAAFFRGELDEVHIFASALNQAMIRRVMVGESP